MAKSYAWSGDMVTLTDPGAGNIGRPLPLPRPRPPPRYTGGETLDGLKKSPPDGPPLKVGAGVGAVAVCLPLPASLAANLAFKAFAKESMVSRRIVCWLQRIHKSSLRVVECLREGLNIFVLARKRQGGSTWRECVAFWFDRQKSLRTPSPPR